MANCANSTPTPTGSRRRLGASLFAVMAGSVITSGIAAGAAVSVADLVSAEPDADLVRLCGEFVALELASCAIYDGPNPITDDDEARAASAPVHARMDTLLDEMELIRATSAIGVLARANVLASLNIDFGYSFDWPDTQIGRLLSYLMRDAAALSGRAAA